MVNKNSKIIYYCVIPLVTLIVLVVWATKLEPKFTPELWIERMTTIYHFPLYNAAHTSNIGHLPLFLFYSYVLITMVILLTLVSFTLRKTSFQIKPLPIIYSLTLTLFISSCLIQAINVHYIFDKELSHKSQGHLYPPKYEGINVIRQFAQNVQQRTSKPLTAQRITDVDCSETKNMFVCRTFKYQFYPIDLYNTRNEPINSKLVYLKSNPRQALDEDDILIYELNARNLFAIKKE